MSNQPPFPPPPPPPPPPGGNPYGQNPYGQNPYGQNPYGQNPYGGNPPGGNPYGQNPMGMQREVPNATAILVLGIVSIVTCWCWGVIGIACSVTALIMANKAMAEYNLNPALYTQSSYKNMNAGRVCAIIGLVLSVIDLILSVIGLATDRHSYYDSWYW